MSHQPVPGAADLLHREHDPRLTHPTRVAVVAERNGPRHRRPLVVVGGMVVGGVVDRASHVDTVYMRVTDGETRGPGCAGSSSACAPSPGATRSSTVASAR